MEIPSRSEMDFTIPHFHIHADRLFQNEELGKPAFPASLSVPIDKIFHENLSGWSS